MMLVCVLRDNRSQAFVLGEFSTSFQRASYSVFACLDSIVSF